MVMTHGAPSPRVRSTENDAPGFHVNTILNQFAICDIKYGYDTTDHAEPYTGTVPVIKYSNTDFVI